MPTIPNPSFTTINYDTNRMNFDTELIDSNLWIQRLKEIKEYDTLRNMQQAFRDIMTCYAKRNSAYVYNQSQSQIQSHMQIQDYLESKYNLFKNNIDQHLLSTCSHSNQLKQENILQGWSTLFYF